MEKAFEYRIYPSQAQKVQLAKTFGCCRWVYNRVLTLRKDEYAQNSKMHSINFSITQIPLWKRTEAPLAQRSRRPGIAAGALRP